ncbi:trans-4-hydroxy-L-proline dehydratase activase [Halanaerobaculum tunisiense]
MEQGRIINLQKYSIHDGTGIRTTLFFKGCPLNCWWCHNPESQSREPEIMFYADKCIGCGTCVKRCSVNAIEIKADRPVVDQEECTLCGRCADFCYNQAREYVGKEITVAELVEEVLKDEIFYEESGGGVTFSGGEPLMQIDFLVESLTACKSRGLHTAVDTSGYAPWEDLERILDKVDVFLYDLKLMDNEAHKKYIGVSNELILKNLERLSAEGSNIFIRIPLIAGVNDNQQNILDSIEFLADLNISQVNLLPYHELGQDKHKRLGMECKSGELERPSEQRISEIKSRFVKSNFKVEIGG